jgi:phospholipase/carboxylesterase
MTERTFSARLGCRYLLHAPDTIDPGTVLVVALHGFSQNPEDMLSLTRDMVGPHQAIAAIEGPFGFFLGMGADKVGYGWITSRRPAESIRLHHEMVGHVLEEAGRELAIPAQRRVLLGFSQSVSLNYRFAAAHPDSVRGVVAICGALPGDWDDARPTPFRPAVLHIARTHDEFYPAERTEQYARRLRLRCDDVEFQLLPGGHRFPSRAGPIWESWLNRILALRP